MSANHLNRREGRPVIRLFGALEIEDGPRTLGARDLGGARPKQVLEILLAARGHRVSTDRLADLLWGDQYFVKHRRAAAFNQAASEAALVQAFCKHRASAERPTPPTLLQALQES